MPTPEYQVVVDVVRTDPSVVTDLLIRSGGLHAPEQTIYEIAEPTFSELKSVDFHVDLTLTAPKDTPRETENALVEVQLSEDPDKPFSWPVHLAMFRRQHRRNAVLVVVTTSQKIADWIGSEITLAGDGSRLVIHVLGPRELREQAHPGLSENHPAFAVLAGLAHAGEPDAFPLAKGAIKGLCQLCGGRRRIVQAVEPGPICRAILASFGLPPEPLPVSPAREPEQLDAWNTGPPVATEQDAPPACDERPSPFDFDQRLPDPSGL